MPTATIETDVCSLLEADDRWAYAQADHFNALAGLFGEGAVLLPLPPAMKPVPGED